MKGSEKGADLTRALLVAAGSSTASNRRTTGLAGRRLRTPPPEAAAAAAATPPSLGGFLDWARWPWGGLGCPAALLGSRAGLVGGRLERRLQNLGRQDAHGSGRYRRRLCCWERPQQPELPLAVPWAGHLLLHWGRRRSAAGLPSRNALFDCVLPWRRGFRDR